MSVDVSWYQENQILLVSFSGDVQLDEIEAASQQCRTLIEEAVENDPPVALIHMLQDGAKIKSFPKNLKQMIDAAEATYSHPRLGWIVAYQADNRFVEFVGNMVSKVMRTRYRIVDTRQDALEFLQDRDTFVPPLVEKTDDKNAPLHSEPGRKTS